jgi:hypothetical protein
VRDGKMSVTDAHALCKAYESGLAGYTYLEMDDGEHLD